MITTIALTLVYQIMLVATVPAILHYVGKQRLEGLRMYRLARTCLSLMLISGGILYAFLYNMETVSDAMSAFVIISVVYFAVMAGPYAEVLFDRPVTVTGRKG